MKISAKTDYTLRLLFELSLDYYKHFNSHCLKMKDISKKCGIPYKFLQQIVLALKKLGYIKTIQGVNGGICLAKKPKEIILGDIIRKLEGEKLPIVCFETSFSRNCRKDICIFISIWQEIEKKVKEVIDNVSFEDLVNRYHEKKNNIVYFI
ncbi:MAG: Rrf2 family transcriptional regulator [Elusimicrobiota bacterium]|nr:Rrf2 family transcriptional regulator [Endomicrobiia bacterium]MCX7911003.1 Rrf2 family transcriptional regulator [Endomicrobiia bacterium]MDW8165253.1 Rrf2 family transcriptional regulator [Elusimicrobiota bacterium]